MVKAAPKSSDLNIDLLPKDNLTSSSNEAVHWVLTVGRYLIIFTEVIALSTFLVGIYLSKQKNDLRGEVKALQNRVAGYQICDSKDPNAFCEDRFRKIQNQINQIASLKGAQTQNNLVVEEFLKLLPVGLKLDSLALDKEIITFSGTLPTETELQTLISSFNASKKINALDITNLSKEASFYKFSAAAAVNRGVFLTSGGNN